MANQIKLYKEVEEKATEDGKEVTKKVVKTCTADSRQVSAMTKAGWDKKDPSKKPAAKKTTV